MDCQALRDHLLNDKLSATHTCWQDGILAHQITDIHHVPGRLNVVANGLSRKDAKEKARERKMVANGQYQRTGSQTLGSCTTYFTPQKLKHQR